jgi:hypothetical protein
MAYLSGRRRKGKRPFLRTLRRRFAVGRSALRCSIGSAGILQEFLSSGAA